MATPDDSLPHDPNHLDTTTSAGDVAAFEETVATKRLFVVWSRLDGPFPLITLLVVLAGIVATGLSYLFSESTFALLYADGIGIWLNRKWWGLLGAVFLHAGILHLVFNCYWIWLLGRLIEREFGPLRYLGFFVGAAVFGSIAEIAWSGEPGIGLSGVAYAYFGFLLVSQSRHPDFRRILSGNTKLLLGGWLVACFVLTYADVLNIANFAHLGGFVAGCVVGAATSPGPWKTAARAAAAVLGIAALSIPFWAPWQPAWQIAHAYRAMNSGDKDTALIAFEKIRTDDPANTWALLQEAWIRSERGEYKQARDLFDQALLHEQTAAAFNLLAWLLATCPDPEVLDGARAIDLARRACALDEWKSAAFIDTLAAAYAETGDFDEAEKWAVKALEIGGPDTEEIQEHLDAFRAHKPWRELPPVVSG